MPSVIAVIPVLCTDAEMIILWLAFSLLSTSTQAPTDQTADALQLLRFLDAIKRGSDTEAQALLTTGAFVGDYGQSQRTSFGDFANYARGCKLSKLTLVPSSDERMPIATQWFCRYPTDDRSASFWLEGKRISRIAWGKPPVIKIPAVRQNGNRVQD